MALGLGFKGGILGIGEESTYGTAVARTKFIELNSDGLQVEEETNVSGAIPDIAVDNGESYQGNITAGGEFETEMRYEGYELLLKHAMGSVASAEVATFAVTSSNKYIDFKEDGGAELNATVAESTYAMGADSSVSGSLCEAIKTALDAAGTGTYTVTFNTTTNILTIAVAGAISAVQILWKTGTHGSDNTDDHIGTLLGYDDTADSSSAASIVAGTAVVAVYDHTFTLADELPTGLSLEADRDTYAALFEGCKINTMAMTMEQAGFLMTTFGIAAENETQTTVTSSTLPTSGYVHFTEGVITYGGATQSATNIEFTLNNNLGVDRRKIGSREILEPKRSGKREVNGTFTIYFEDQNAYNNFRNFSKVALSYVFTTTGTIKSGFNYTMTVSFPVIRTGNVNSQPQDEGAMTVEVPFVAESTDSTTREFNIVLRNTVVSV